MVDLPVWLVLILAIVLLIAGLRWCAVVFSRANRAKMANDGVQELEVLVRGGFRPSTIVVKSGIPARLYFNRQEDVPCSAQVIFSRPRQERSLPPFVRTPVQFIPTHPGEFLFTCSTGLYQGRLIVEK